MVAGTLIAAVLVAPPSLPSGIRWSAQHPECPATSDVEAAVQRLAGRVPGAEEIEVDATVVAPAQDGGRWRLDLVTVVDGVSQQRTLFAETCPALSKATAVIIAVSLDPIATASAVRRAEVAAAAPSPSPEPPPPGPAIEAAPLPPPAVTEPRPPPRPPRPSVAVHLGVGGNVVVGMLPGVSGGPTLAVGISRGRFRADLRGRYFVPRFAEVGDGGGVGAEVQAGAAALLACGVAGKDKVAVPLCGGVEVGGMRARGRGVPNARAQSWPWVAALVGAGVRYSLRPRFALALDIEAAIAVVRNRVVLGSTAAETPVLAHENAPVGARGLLGVEFRLGGDRG